MRECSKKRIAWISVPAFISTDMFIIPEMSKHYQIDWYLLAKDNEKIDFLEQAKDLNRKGVFGLEIIDIHYRSSNIRTALEYKDFLERIKKKNYDVVYNVMVGIPYYMPLLKKIIGDRKTLVAIHNVHVPKGGSRYYSSIIYTKYTIRAFKYFQTFSEAQKKELKKKTKDKYCESVNFVLMDYGQPTTSYQHKEIVFLSFGIIRDYKRIDVIIEAAQAAYEKVKKKFKVIIAGSCDNWDEYQRLIKYPELFDLRITRVDDDRIPNLFAEADYFLAPYQDIAQSGSAIIALNYDMPIIASRLDAFEAYIEDGVTGYLIKPASTDELSDTIIKILENHNYSYDAMKKEISIRKNRMFSAEAVCDKYRKNIEAVLAV